MDDQRQAQLIAAADALRRWVHAQKATWQDGPGLGCTPLHAAATAATVIELPLADPDADPVPSSDTHISPPVEWMAHLRSAAGVSVRAVASVLGLSVRFWRPALASILVIAFVGVARTSWPQWIQVVRRQLAAAGEHVSVFDRRPAPAPAPEKPVKRIERAASSRRGRLHVDSDPTGAKVVVDGKEHGVTPLSVNDLAAGPHEVLLESENGSVRHTVVVAADKTTRFNEAIYSGWLHVSSTIDLQLSDNGKGLQLDDSNQVLLPPGVHPIRFENRMYGFVDTRDIEIRPGDTAAVSIEPPPSRLTIRASTPAEVFIDGVLVGGTPLNDYALPLGVREIAVRNAAGVEKRETITMTVQPVVLEVDFSK